MIRILLAVLGLLVVSLFFFPSPPGAVSGNAGEIFYHATKYSFGSEVRRIFSPTVLPAPFKIYKTARKIPLPQPEFKGITVEQALMTRRTIRNFSSKALSMAELSQLLFAAQGVTGKYSDTLFRAAPSAGALYPIETYVLAGNVDGLPSGLYHYHVVDHALELLKEGDFRTPFRKAAVDQEMVEEAPVTFIFTAIWQRVGWKYGERGYRYAFIEAGCIAENIYLQGASMGLATTGIGSFHDDDIHALLGLDGTAESAVFMHSVGHQR